MRRLMILSLAAAFTIPLTANGVRAAAPTVEHISDSGSFVDHEFCGFALHVDWQFRARRYTWTDASGDVTRWAQHGVFSETVRANEWALSSTKASTSMAKQPKWRKP